MGGGGSHHRRRAEAAEERARQEHALRVQAEAKAKAESETAKKLYEEKVRDAEVARVKAEEKIALEEQRFKEMMEATERNNAEEMAIAKLALEQAQNEANEAINTAEQKAAEAAENAKIAAEAKAEADAKDLRIANDNSVIQEPETAHSIKHAEICARLHLDKRSVLIAHIGRTGVGKSSFINAERGMTDRQTDAAKTDYVECTSEMKAFKMPNEEYVIVDVPGCGARGFLVEDYSKQLHLIGFDFLLIFVTHGRIVRDDVALAKYAVKNGIKMAFVHSRCDETLRNLFEHCESDADCEREKLEFLTRSRLLLFKRYVPASAALQTKLRSWEDDRENQILLAGIKVFYVSAPATRAVVARSKGLQYNAELMKYALPDDLCFVESITDIVNANLSET